MKYMLGTVAAMAIASTAALADEVRVYNWSDYIDEDLLAKFEEETGIKLIYDVLTATKFWKPKCWRGLPATTLWFHREHSCSA